MTKEELNVVLERRFSRITGPARGLAKGVAELLTAGKDSEAKTKFSEFCKNEKLVLWEQLALSDLVGLFRSYLANNLEIPSSGLAAPNA